MPKGITLYIYFLLLSEVYLQGKFIELGLLHQKMNFPSENESQKFWGFP